MFRPNCGRGTWGASTNIHLFTSVLDILVLKLEVVPEFEKIKDDAALVFRCLRTLTYSDGLPRLFHHLLDYANRMEYGSRKEFDKKRVCIKLHSLSALKSVKSHADPTKTAMQTLAASMRAHIKDLDAILDEVECLHTLIKRQISIAELAKIGTMLDAGKKALDTVATSGAPFYDDVWKAFHETILESAKEAQVILREAHLREVRFRCHFIGMDPSDSLDLELRYLAEFLHDLKPDSLK